MELHSEDKLGAVHGTLPRTRIFRSSIMTKVYFEHTAIKIRIMQTNEYGFESRYQHDIICFACVVLEAEEGGLVKDFYSATEQVCCILERR